MSGSISKATPSILGGDNPVSLLELLLPLVEELGRETFVLLLARSSRQRMARDWSMLLEAAGGDFEATFRRWMDDDAREGWGQHQVAEFDRERKRACLVVRDPWELRLQEPLPPDSKWGCPLLLGRIAGVFSATFEVDCWAQEHHPDNEPGTVAVFTVYPSRRSLDSDLEALRGGTGGKRELQLESKIASKSHDLEAARRELENRSRELLRERTRALRKEIEERERAERFKDELVSTVNHELRTPLASLRGFAELLLRREFAPEDRLRFLSIIHDESVRLNNIVNDFLDLQRLDADVEGFALEPVDLAPLLRQCGEIFSQGEHRIESQVPAELPPVPANQAKIQQIVTNLLSNAVKYSSKEKRIKLQACVEDDELLIRVKDQGAGIPQESLPHLFTRFYRVDNADTRRTGGTGLGLSIVKKLVDGHRGRIEVESVLGEGSTFSVFLPCKNRAYSEPEERAP